VKRSKLRDIAEEKVGLMKRKGVLFLCTTNSCRSQMAGFVKEEGELEDE
jgi:hypothetical protein